MKVHIRHTDLCVVAGRSAVVAGLALAFLAGVRVARAVPPATAPATLLSSPYFRPPFVVPEVSDILAKARAAEGSDAAVAAIHNRQENGTSQAVMQGGFGEFGRLTTAEGLQYVLITGQSNFRRVMVVNADGCWESSAGKVRPLTDAELDLTRRRTALFPLRDVYKYFAKVELVDVRDVNKKPALVLRLVSKADPEETEDWFLDRETYLLVRRDFMSFGRFGRLPASTTLGDYREVDGVKIPFLVVNNTDGMVQEYKLTEVKQNVPVEPSTFNKPDPQPVIKGRR